MDFFVIFETFCDQTAFLLFSTAENLTPGGACNNNGFFTGNHAFSMAKFHSFSTQFLDASKRMKLFGAQEKNEHSAKIAPPKFRGGGEYSSAIVEGMWTYLAFHLLAVDVNFQPASTLRPSMLNYFLCTIQCP